MIRWISSPHVAFTFPRYDGLSLSGVAGLILGMDQGRFEQEMPPRCPGSGPEFLVTPTGDFPGNWRPNTGSAVALFEQLRLRIIELVDAGVLAVGAKLPPVRNLAGVLDVAPHTVARAYKELEAAGVVATRGRNGTVVCARDDRWGALARCRRGIRRRCEGPRSFLRRSRAASCCCLRRRLIPISSV